MRFLYLLRGLLARRHSLAWTIGLTVLLLLPVFATGRALDDHTHHAMVEHMPTLERAPHDLYSFVLDDPDVRARTLRQGYLPWYTGSNLKLTFFRPLASLSLALDYWIAPASPRVAHLHSLLWYLAVVAAVAATYRRLLTVRWAAMLATALFAVDDAHGFTVGWVANRHALLAMAFAVTGLYAHVRWRQSHSRGWGLLPPALLGVGLLSSAEALCIVAYFVAYAWVLDRGGRRSRLLSLVPALSVCALWQLASRWLGYGVSGSDVYVDPLHDPWRFLGALAQRWPVLVHAQLTPFGADAAEIFSPLVRIVSVSLAVAGLLVMLVVAWRRLQRDAQTRFWCLGLALSAVPLCAVFPNDRLLLPLGLGGAGLVARCLCQFTERGALGETRAARGLAWFWVGTHLVLAPLLLPIRAYSVRWFGGLFETAARSLDVAQPLAGRTLVIVTGPDFFFTSWATLIRHSLGLDCPERTRVLGTTQGDVQVTRPDEHTLVLDCRDGLLTAPLDGILRSRAEPFRVGDRVGLGDSEVEVMAVTPDGRPARVRTRFATELEHPSLTWVAWTVHGYRRFVPPAVGETRRVEGVTRLELASLLWEPPTK